MSLKSNIINDLEHKRHNNKENDSKENEKLVTKKRVYDNLQDFIAGNKSGYGSKEETHMVWYPTVSGTQTRPNINFKVRDEDYENFLELYTSECKTNFGKMNILEKPCEIGPLILDFDLKQICKERTITADDIMQVVEIINGIIIKNYKINDENSEVLMSYVMMKKKPFAVPEKKCYSDGFHIQYPNLIINSEQRFLIYDESKKEIISKDLFSEALNMASKTQLFVEKKKEDADNDTENLLNDDSEFSEEQDSDDINYYSQLTKEQKDTIHNELFDSSVIIKNKWFLYGSGKNFNGKMNIYELAYIFDCNAELVTDYRPSLSKLIKILSIRGNEEPSIKMRKNDEIVKKLEYIRSIYVNKTMVKKTMDFGKIIIKNEDDEDYPNGNQNNKLVENKVVENRFANKPTENEDKEITYAKKLVKILKDRRADPYDEWIRVGWALYSISPTLLPEFIQFSKRAPSKYQTGACEKIWRECEQRVHNLGKTGYTIASLFHWAKLDNPSGYDDFKKDIINSALEAGDITADYDVASIIYTMYHNEFVCCSIKQNKWYHFEKHRWQKIEETQTLSIKLSEELSLKFLKLASTYYNKSTDLKGMQADMYKGRADNLKKLSDKLKDVRYKERILKACKEIFYVKDFDKSLDQNNYLVGFNNGIYDLEARVFRPGTPDDLVSKSTGYDYKVYNRDDQLIKDLEKFLRSIQPDDDMYLYVMAYCASHFEGSNSDQKFMIWTGSGGNGKGRLVYLMENTFGEYSGSLQPTAITEKRNSSAGASPDIADQIGVRSICIQEPNSADNLNLGFVKQITGEDTLQVRALYSDPFKLKPQFKLVLCCNKLPQIPEGGEGGTWRRIRVVDFSQKFVENPSGPGEQKADNDINNKIKNWFQGFAWLLLNVFYPKYKEKGIEGLTPERVKLSTEKYKCDSNVYIEFINEYVVFEERQVSEKALVWDIFKQWYSGSFEGKPPSQKKLWEFFQTDDDTRKKCSIKGSIIKGMILKDKNEQINNPIDA